ncbi:hypothetical protein DFAR_2220012 [Desulfarculales bacterium]
MRCPSLSLPPWQYGATLGVVRASRMQPHPTGLNYAQATELPGLGAPGLYLFNKPSPEAIKMGQGTTSIGPYIPYRGHPPGTRQKIKVAGWL